MGMRRCPELVRVTLVATVMAGLGMNAGAQTTPPRPSFDINRYPDLFFNVWPADVNEDGITDLVAGTRALRPSDRGDVVVAIGRGNGTFADAYTVDFRALPLTVADFNADGFADIVILRDRSVEILAGNGNGTFDAPVKVTTANTLSQELRQWAYAADLNGDGRRDLLLPDFVEGPVVLKLLPGSGALTFGAPVLLQTPDGGMPPADVTGGDFNGDGRRDFAVANICCELSIYINQGSNTFARTDLPAGVNDVVAADVNGDGRLDLVSVSGRFDVFSGYSEPGEVQVRLGNGNGTFGTPARYPTGVAGSSSVVTGDFNGDGRTDIAAGSRSVIEDSDLGGHLYDSVSVLAGNGAGGFAAPAVLVLDYVRHGEFGIDYSITSPYWGQHHQLNTSDVNGDRRTDLITSPGAVLLNRTPRTNRPPLVFAGPDRSLQTGDNYVDLGAEASDPDLDWLTYRWTDDSGQVISDWPFVRATHDTGTTRTYTLTVTDGRGGTASDSVTIRNANNDFDPYLVVTFPGTDARIQAGVPYTVTWSADTRNSTWSGFAVEYSLNDGRTFAPIPGCTSVAAAVEQCTWTNPGPLTANGRVRVIGHSTLRGDWIAVSYRFAIIAEPVLPDGWDSKDIGAVAAAGRASASNGVWTIDGSGADIWDAADEFRYAYRTAGSQFSFTARVANIENLDKWVKAGIMVREDLSPGSRHVSLFATPRTDRGLAFQRRLVANAYSTHTAGPAVRPPVWLRIGRSGDTVTAYYATSATGPWILVGQQVVPELRTALYVGLAVSSHVDGALATAVFDNVAFVGGTPFNQSGDIGAVGLPGASTFDGVVYELQGSGTDIWGRADAFNFLWTWGYYSSFSIASISARVLSVEDTHPWAKAGVMYREIFGAEPRVPAEARHVMVAVTPGRGVAMQYRPTPGGQSVQVAARPGAAPAFVRLRQSGDTFTGEMSEDGSTWTVLGQVTLPQFYAAPGLVVTSHDNTQRATARFDEVRFGFF